MSESDRYESSKLPKPLVNEVRCNSLCLKRIPEFGDFFGPLPPTPPLLVSYLWEQHRSRVQNIGFSRHKISFVKGEEGVFPIRGLVSQHFNKTPHLFYL